MTNRRQIQDPSHALELMFAGNARITLVSPKTGKRYTYRIRQSKDGSVFFVGLLTGPDNYLDYTYLGIVSRDSGMPSLTRKSRITDETTACWQAFTFTYWQLKVGRMPVHFWHEGKCCRCGRALTVPESIERGIGPECARIVDAA